MKPFLVIFFLFSSATSGIAQSLYSATGKATFYGKKFEGRKTASGEIFSNKNFTAAHRTLPFGTRVKVTNLVNHDTVIVRINDRGPYVKGRIIDLTKAVADSLDFIHSGWVKVKVEELPPIDTTIVAHVLVDNQPMFQFPNSWIGDWKGELKTYSKEGLKNLIPMELHIHPFEDSVRYSWTIVYDTLSRNYELVKIDEGKNSFAIDEKDGIMITSSLLGNQFISRFEVDGSLLDCVYEMVNTDEIDFQIRAGDDDHSWSTGDIVHASDSIPKVKVYEVNFLQEAALYRVK